MSNVWAARAWASNVWAANMWRGVEVPPVAGGGGAVPEEFAFSIRNQRVSNHAAAAARSVLKPAGFSDDDWVKSVQQESARAHRKMALDAAEEEAMIILLLAGFE